VNYDSTAATQAHIMRVGELISFVVLELLKRASAHDKSKLEEPEKGIFDVFTPKLRDVTYGSEKYKAFMAEMGVAIRHHHFSNRHHPEFFNGPEWGGNRGIEAMNLVDLVEMICDWVAASERHADGDPIRSIEVNKERFGYSADLASILANTVRAIKAGDSAKV
jgi:hypothetical protein